MVAGIYNAPCLCFANQEAENSFRSRPTLQGPTFSRQSPLSKSATAPQISALAEDVSRNSNLEERSLFHEVMPNGLARYLWGRISENILCPICAFMSQNPLSMGKRIVDLLSIENRGGGSLCVVNLSSVIHWLALSKP